MMHTAESDSRCASYHGVKFRGVHHAAESSSVKLQCDAKFRWSLVAFEGTILEILLGVNTSIMKEKILSFKC